MVILQAEMEDEVVRRCMKDGQYSGDSLQYYPAGFSARVGLDAVRSTVGAFPCQ